MKKLLVLILSVLLGLGALAACGGDTDDSSGPVVSEAVQRTITLKGVKGSQEVEIPEQMKRKDGNYPSTYYEGIGAQVDTLKDYEDRNNEWRFLGWYTDKACTEKFEGTIDITQTGDVTLYAKLYYAAWTDPA